MSEPTNIGPSGSHVFDQPPLHMDRWTRNERLYGVLVNMGLFVQPVPDELGRIDHLVVNSEFPTTQPKS